MIKVIFKADRKNTYEGQEFTYADYEGAEVGDVVVVNTRYGFAIAIVSAVGVYDERFDKIHLATVVTVIYPAKEARAKRAKEQACEELRDRIRRKRILKEMSEMGLNEEEYKMIEEMSNEKLISFYKSIIKGY